MKNRKPQEKHTNLTNPMTTDKTIRMPDNMITEKTIRMQNPMTTDKTIFMQEENDLSNKTIRENTSSNRQKDSDINIMNNEESGKEIEQTHYNKTKHPQQNVKIISDSKRSNSNQEKTQPKGHIKYDRK